MSYSLREAKPCELSNYMGMGGFFTKLSSRDLLSVGYTRRQKKKDYLYELSESFPAIMLDSQPQQLFTILIKHSGKLYRPDLMVAVSNRSVFRDRHDVIQQYSGGYASVSYPDGLVSFFSIDEAKKFLNHYKIVADIFQLSKFKITTVGKIKDFYCCVVNKYNLGSNLK